VKTSRDNELTSSMEPQVPAGTGGQNDSFEIASDKILAKEFDGEMTLINLDTGVYFAAGGPALDIWQALAAGREVAATARRLVARYGVTEGVALSETAKFAALFVGYGLLIPSTASANVGGEEDLQQDPEEWSEPWVEDYGDMQDLLLLDPVHDVNGGAWPRAG
jgi:hypothetical protein